MPNQRNLPDTAFSEVSPLRPQADDIPITKAKWIGTEQSDENGNDDLESVLNEHDTRITANHRQMLSGSREPGANDGVPGNYWLHQHSDERAEIWEKTSETVWVKLTAAISQQILSAAVSVLETEIVDALSIDRHKGLWKPATYAVKDEVSYVKSDNSRSQYRRTSAGTDGAGDNPETNSDWEELSGRPELAAHLHELANGMKKGGTANQILEKIDGTDFNTRWVDPAAGTGPANSIPDYEIEPDPDDFSDGQIIFFQGKWLKRYSTHATVANQFAGNVGFQIRDGVSFRGIAGPNRFSSYQAFGEFTSNPGNAIGMLVASGSTMQVSIRADLYVAAKGSAFADTDIVYVRLDGNGAETVRCPYDLTYHANGHTWYFFDGRPTGARALNDVSDGDPITFTIDSDNSGTPLFTHDAATGHWIEWVPDSVLDLLSAPGVYTVIKDIIQNGDRISWISDDDARTLTPDIDFPPVPESLRYRAVVSNDVRVTTEKYQIEYGGNSYTVQRSASRINSFTPVHPNLPDGLNATKVNLYYDGGDHQFNPSGVDFTAESAGSTTRTIKCTLEIAPDPSQERSNNDVIQLEILTFGRASSSVTSKRLAFANHQDYPFKIHFDLTYTNAPRGGLADAIAFTLSSSISRIKIIPKLTYYLPFTGAALPRQKYDQPGTNGHVLLSNLSAQEHDQIVPEELVRELHGYGTSRMALWEIPSGSSNNEGRNDPTEEDHSDSMRAALGSHGNVFIESAQDLSQLHLTLHQKAEVVSPRTYSIYLCTYLRGVLKPEVVAHGTLHSVAPPWTIDWTGKGILKGQRFYILAQDVIGDAEIIWDATIQDTVKSVTVKPGFTTSREIILGNAANTFTLGNIVNLPPVETWVKLRFFSSGLVSTIDWPENYLEGFPNAAGQPSLTHIAIGPISVHEQQSSGSIVHNRYVVPFQDGPDWKLAVYTGSGLDSVYLDKIELEYELLV